MGYRREAHAAIGGVRVRRIRRVLWVVLVLNIAVAAAKLIWGYVSGSIAMQADGYHSMFDGASNIVGLIGLGLASRPADRGHPYGHSKYETHASAAIGAMLALAAYAVGSTAIERLMTGGVPPRVDAIAFTVMLVTLAVNVGVTTYERWVGKRLNSDILLADAKHTGSDVLVSLGVIGGLIAVRLGYPVADPLIALAVAGAIAYAAWGIFKQAGVTLSDAARIPPDDIGRAACEVPGVLGCHDVRTRGSDAEVYVDLHIQVAPEMTVEDGHEVAEEVERAICRRFSQVVDVIVHLEPLDDYQIEKTIAEQEAASE